jgi:molybdate transport system permease protein
MSAESAGGAGEARATAAVLGRSRSDRVVAISDAGFYLVLIVISLTYLVLIVSMLAADFAFMARERGGPAGPSPMVAALADPRIQYSIWLSMTACTLSAIISLWVSVPLGYLISRHPFVGRNLVDAIIDVPIVLPPLVVGLSLLILFQFWPFRLFAREIVYQLPAVVLAQFAVACAFAVRTMKTTFDHIDPRCEQVALSLGCTRMQAFGWVVLPEARRGMTTAFTLAWARSLGEFGPLLIFAGATRMKTEVLSTSVFLEMNVGDVTAAVAVSLIMVVAAIAVLIVARLWGIREGLL